MKHILIILWMPPWIPSIGFLSNCCLGLHAAAVDAAVAVGVDAIAVAIAAVHAAIAIAAAGAGAPAAAAVGDDDDDDEASLRRRVRGRANSNAVVVVSPPVWSSPINIDICMKTDSLSLSFPVRIRKFL